MVARQFDRNRLIFKKLNERKNKVFIERDHVPVNRKPADFSESDQLLIRLTAERIRLARFNQKSVMLAFGAHTIKNGMALALIALIEEGWLTHLATNGASIIHDWEFAYQGKSSEDVRENVALGQFGLWEETGFFINLALAVGAYEGLGYGESIGKMISKEGLQIPDLEFLYSEAAELMRKDHDLAAATLDLAGIIDRFTIKPGFLSIPHPFKKYSVQSRAFELGIPFTGHPMFGHDIIYCHPLNNGAAIGRAALRDFLCFAESISNLDSGVYLSVGSAVMSPMIFEKSLSMSQNVKIHQNNHIDNHFLLIVDLARSDWDWQKDGEPPVDNPAYFLRYLKTFHRMGGEAHYLSSDNRDFLLALHHQLSGRQTF